ncbi:hypothetical protein SAMN05216315_13320 [Nitrosospira sp. Nsp18]|nr:hypothetical protein SAMN05216315_13320 [Nitrosospira sp. Nsp18]
MVQNAHIRSDHDVLAKFFEEAAEKWRRSSRTKEVLEHYEEKSIYMVGKHKI